MDEKRNSHGAGLELCTSKVKCDLTNHLASQETWQETLKRLLLFEFDLNMFLVPIKFETSKFSPYLILIAFLVPIKIIYM